MNDIKGIIEDCYKSDLVSDRVIKKVVEIIGQGEWQNLHDENSDICTTMGELIITLERFADLEKENAELQNKVDTLQGFLDRDVEFDNLQKENAELKARLNAINLLTPELQKRSQLKTQQLTKAKEIILRLYNAGRDVLMCRAEEKAYDNLSNAINDKSIEQFLNSEVEK